MLPGHDQLRGTSVRAISRREFLRALAVAGGGAALGSLLAACSQAIPPAPSQTPAAASASSLAASSASSSSASPAAGSGSAASQSAAKPGAGGAASFKIGASIPLTGRYAALGEQVKNGYELAFEDLNKDGVANKATGQKVTLELKVLDDESDPTKTVQRLETLANDQVLAYLGGAGSDLHASAATAAEKNKTPYIGIAFALLAVHQKGLKYLFSPFPKSPGIAKTVFDMMDGVSPKPASVAIFAEKTDWGGELRDLWKKEAGARGYDVVTDEQYAPASKDFAPMILKAKSGKTDAVLALPTPPDGIAIAKQMKELDFNAKYYFFIRASDGLNWGQALGKDGDYFINMPGWSPDLKFPGVEHLKQRHQAKYGKSAEALTGAAYGAVQVLFDAVARAARLEHDALRDALAGTDMTTVAGPVKFNPDGTAQVIVACNQWQGGKQVLVWPKDQGAAPLQYPAKPWTER